MATRIEPFARDNEERRLEEEVRSMTPEQARKYLEQEATLYLDMVFGYSSEKRLMQRGK
jgi:hypothetical protein